MQLEDLRTSIDKIDDQIVELYAQRMNFAKQIATVKKTDGVAISNSLREKSILSRVVNKVDEDIKLYTKQVFNTLFETSKAYQNTLSDIPSNLKETIKNVLDKGIKQFPAQATVACQGIEGAYSNIAAEKAFAISDLVYFKDFEGVFSAVNKGLCEFGVLPIDNSLVGSVNAVYDLMRKNRFYIVRSVKLKINHYLMSKKGAKLADIKEIFSHEQAIGQCSEFIKTLSSNIKITMCPNTAVAAKMVSQSERTDIACISSLECASIYNLSVLESNVQNKSNNYTRFIIIAKQMQIYEDSNKISIMVNLPNEVGSLNGILNKFYTLGLNLTKLESRPILDTTFEYSFYFDFDAKIEKKEVQNLLSELENTTQQFVFLGCYKEIM